MGMDRLDSNKVPEILRSELFELDRRIASLGETIMEILCEGLGLERDRLKNIDLSVLTVLLQDQIGGLQVKHGEDWVDVKPLDGALVINIGDILQIMSNDKYRSVEHRVWQILSGNQEFR
ncbi:1-aminocyclopropane-1-carboxylate oxidase homolog 11-like [Papaver somniferum]|uniref:1-aminocyclopropane-1-carboxylate oxidase homolog 11-like n=1 Tax=Papaver somniferum TaxID=3469 RepID=UPI000E6F6B65|nr:1-aminocyclopropane-1-carboxylate oxidase homolog 11-like [Papaver somniferum]